MSQPRTKTVRLRVSSAAAPYLGAGAPRERQLAAARGESPLEGRDLLAALFYLGHSRDPELRETARQTLADLPGPTVAAVLADPELPSEFLDFLARQRPRDLEGLEALFIHPALAEATLAWLAAELEAEAVAVLLARPRVSAERRRRLEEAARERGLDLDQGSELAPPPEDADEETRSKYQLAMEMGVADKIKTAMTGDKEWRSLFLRDSNKLVSSAALKNPRITEGEVLTLARNKSTSDELIRLIVLNREWVKNPEIQKALVSHPRTPLHKALRYMNVLTQKELKFLAKSKGVPQAIVNNARRMLSALDRQR